MPKTRAYVEDALCEFTCEVTRVSKSSLLAFFDAGKPETLAFRADMDALPVTEKNDVPYRSLHEGCMHACGHDGHTAALLVFAKTVNDSIKKLPRNVLLIFQENEERDGGAKIICDTGAFEKYNVKYVFGCHLWPDVPPGVIASRPGPLMAQTAPVHLTITGKSAHVARAAEGTDALEPGIRFVSALYEAEKKLPSGEPRLLKFGSFHSGTADNVLSGETRIEGTLRTYSRRTFDFLRDAIFSTLDELKKTTNCKYELEFNDGYPAVVNDEALYEKVKALLGEELSRVEAPAVTAEDFSEYQKKAPGVFFFVGCGGHGALHSGDFDFDERALDVITGLYERLLYI